MSGVRLTSHADAHIQTFANETVESGKQCRTKCLFELKDFKRNAVFLADLFLYGVKYSRPSVRPSVHPHNKGFFLEKKGRS